MLESPLPTSATFAKSPSINLEGKNYVLSDSFDLNNPASIPKYSCVSYAWGEERVPHVLRAGTTDTMSTHTIPAFVAAIRAMKSSGAIWIDTFCVPHDEPAKRFTLESMGFIYSQCEEVIVMLSSTAGKAIEQMGTRGGGRVTEEGLRGLEEDRWATRLWTYQESANAQDFYFTYEGASKKAALVDGADFFNCLGFSLKQMGKEKGIDDVALTKLFPTLSNLEDVFAEMYYTPYGRRSALVVMTSIQRRTVDSVQNLFYAMTCAVTTKPSPGLWDMVDQNPAETFMRTCEENNDYSFIYSCDERDETPGRRWRPKPNQLIPILFNHSYGEAQRGHRTSEGLWLEGMLHLSLSPMMDLNGRDFIMGWLNRPDLVDETDSVLAQACVLKLKEFDFQGLPHDTKLSVAPTETAGGASQSPTDYLILGDGIFVPQRPLEIVRILRILVSNQIFWSQGAPGLVEIKGTEGSEYIVGVYVGYKSGLRPDANLVSALL